MIQRWRHIGSIKNLTSDSSKATGKKNLSRIYPVPQEQESSFWDPANPSYFLKIEYVILSREDVEKHVRLI